MKKANLDMSVTQILRVSSLRAFGAAHTTTLMRGHWRLSSTIHIHPARCKGRLPRHLVAVCPTDVLCSDNSTVSNFIYSKMWQGRNRKIRNAFTCNVKSLEFPCLCVLSYGIYMCAKTCDAKMKRYSYTHGLIFHVTLRPQIVAMLQRFMSAYLNVPYILVQLCCHCEDKYHVLLLFWRILTIRCRFFHVQLVHCFRNAITAKCVFGWGIGDHLFHCL